MEIAMGQPIPEMVWIDMETTGTDEVIDVPLELGLMVTNRFGREIDHISWLVVDEAWKDRVEDAKQDELVGPMHRINGLWFDWDQALTLGQNTPRYVQDKAMDWLDKKEVPYGQMPLCGSSLRMDRAFCKKYLPDIEYFFSYRIIDISSDKEQCKLLNPKVYEKMIWPDAKAHRVIMDIRDSIREYQYYLDNFLWVANGSD